MKYGLKRVICLILCALTVPCVITGCGSVTEKSEKDEKEENEMKKGLPDYSDSENKFYFYSYGAPGTDGITATEEKIELYAEAGFNKYMFFGANEAKSTNQAWDASHRAINAANAFRHGFESIIIRDERLKEIAIGDALGEHDDVWLKEQVITSLGNYINKKRADGNYIIDGVDIGDEPQGKKLNSYSRVYKMIKKVAAENFGRNDLQIYVCLLPAYGGLEMYTPDGSKANESDRYKIYREYVSSYLDATEETMVACDIYPFMYSKKKGKYFIDGYYATLKILSEECRDRGIKTAFVAQSYSARESYEFRTLNAAEMKLQMNSIIGFGAKEIGFYRYKALSGAKEPEAYFVLDDELTKTEIYDLAKKETETAKKFEKTVLSFDYSASALSGDKNSGYYADYTAGVDNDVFKKIKIANNANIALVTELYDSVNGLYMYMLQNVTDTIYAEGEKARITLTAEFTDYDRAAVIREGDTTFINLASGTYSVTLSAGEAVYVIPY